MTNKVTIKDIARMANTSVASVHRALNGSAGVGEALREKICQIALEYNYQINETAALLRRKPITIFVILPDAIGNERYYYKGIWRGITERAESIIKQNGRIHYIKTDGFESISRELQKFCTDEGKELPDGIITCCSDEETETCIEYLLGKGVKLALIDRTCVLPGLTCLVNSSLEDMGRLGYSLASRISDKETGSLYIVCGSMSPDNRLSYQSAILGKHAEGSDSLKLEFFSPEDEYQTRLCVTQILQDNQNAFFLAANARSTYWICDEIQKNRCSGKAMPAVIGVDIFPELIPFFESDLLIASIYQSHQQYGSIALQYLFDQLVTAAGEDNRYLPQPVSIIMKDNYKYYIN